MPLAYVEDEKRAIQDMISQSAIRKSTSPWSSPLVLVKKKKGKIRPCVDYRRLKLTGSEIMACPQDDGKFIFDTDASHVGDRNCFKPNSGKVKAQSFKANMSVHTL